MPDINNIAPSLTVDVDAALFNVPAAHSAANSTMRDVLGNKTDTSTDSSVYGLLKKLVASAGIDVDEDLEEILAFIGTPPGGEGPATLFDFLVAVANNFLNATVNSAANLLIADVIGNKSDTVAGTSLVALLKQALADFVIPTLNAATNVTIRDVIGNKNDDSAGSSLFTKNFLEEKHMHSVARVYPALANGVTVSKANASWALGTIVEIIPANFIQESFDIHFIHFDSISASDTYEIVLYQGAGDVEIGRTRFTRVASNNEVQAPFQSVIVPANARIRAQVAGKSIGAGNCIISLGYHTY